MIISGYVTLAAIHLQFFINDMQRGLTPPYVDDGMLEIVGFRDGWHGLVLLAPNGHGNVVYTQEPTTVNSGHRLHENVGLLLLC